MMIVLKFFLCLLIILIMILIMPVRYIYDMKINNEINEKLGSEIYLCVKYFFCVIKYEYPSNKLKIFGINIIQDIKAKAKSNKKNKKKLWQSKSKKYKINRPKHKKKLAIKINYDNICFLTSIGLKFIMDIKKKLWPKKIIIKGEIGFDDPAHTGYLCALDNLIKKYIELDLKYNFNKKIIGLDIFLSGKICLLNLIFVLAKYLKDRSLISFLKSNYILTLFGEESPTSVSGGVNRY